jgi:hypothetical protein
MAIEANDRNTTNPSRRAVLGAIAATPALAGPTAAIAGASPDPIFATIERHRAAWEAYEAATIAAGDMDHGIPDELHRLPRVAVGEQRELFTSAETLEDGTTVIRSKWGKPTGEFYYAHDLADIERSAPKKLSASEREAWIGERKAELEKDERELAERKREAKRKSGILAAEEQMESARDREEELLRHLAVTAPTTISGVQALLAYWCQHHTRDAIGMQDEWHDTTELLATLATALDKFARGAVA